MADDLTKLRNAIGADATEEDLAAFRRSHGMTARPPAHMAGARQRFERLEAAGVVSGDAAVSSGGDSKYGPDPVYSKKLKALVEEAAARNAENQKIKR